MAHNNRVLKTRGVWSSSKRLSCRSCKREIEYQTPNASDSQEAQFFIECCFCNELQEFNSEKFASKDSKSNAKMNDKPDINYYDILGVERDASSEEIKKCYRKKAVACHPDRPGGSNAEFLRLSEAYATLSNESSRKIYDKFGTISGQDSNNHTQLQQAMAQIFGGGEYSLWKEFIGELQIISDMSDMITDDNSNEGGKPTDDKKKQDEEKANEKQAKRIKTLTQNLQKRLDQYVDLLATNPSSALDMFREEVRHIVSDLVMEPFGAQLCHFIGELYSLYAESYTDSPVSQSFWLPSYAVYRASFKLKSKGLYSTWSVFKKALAVRSALNQLNNNKNEDSDEATKKAQEEKAAKAAFEVMWESVKFELLNLINNVNKQALETELESAGKLFNLSNDEVLKARIVALHELGSIFSAAQTNENDPVASNFPFMK